MVLHRCLPAGTRWTPVEVSGFSRPSGNRISCLPCNQSCSPRARHGARTPAALVTLRFPQRRFLPVPVDRVRLSRYPVSFRVVQQGCNTTTLSRLPYELPSPFYIVVNVSMSHSDFPRMLGRQLFPLWPGSRLPSLNTSSRTG